MDEDINIGPPPQPPAQDIDSSGRTYENKQISFNEVIQDELNFTATRNVN